MLKTATISTELTLVIEECCRCGMMFGMTQDVQRRLGDNGGTFYCPHGHGQSYTEPTVEVLRKQLREEQGRVAQIQSQLNGTLSELVGKTRELTKIKRRINAGVCPYCKRHFVNLQRHVECKHKKE